MRDLDDLKLSECDRKYLMKFGKSIGRIYMNYIIVGIMLCLTIVGLIMGIVMRKNEGFVMSIIFAQVGFNLFITSRKYKRLYRIISHLEQCIEKLGK